MSASAARQIAPLTRFEQLRLARDVLRSEGQALISLSEKLAPAFCEAVALLRNTRGSVIVAGVGKAGWIGQKISATLASTGTRSHFLHPSEALHGDLGRVGPDDAALVLSYSGESAEIVQLLPPLMALRAPIVAITGRCRSSLARAAQVTIDLGSLEEACPLGLAPTTSSTAMLAVGDALAIVTSRMRGFTAGDFARCHPAGNLGRKLALVEDVMRRLEHCRVAIDSKTVREALVDSGRTGRRTGAMMLVDEHGILSGILTDSDLAKLLEKRRDDALDRPIRDVMTPRPTTMPRGARLGDAVEILAARKLSELPVIDEAGRPCGLIDITDVLTLVPASAEDEEPTVPIRR